MKFPSLFMMCEARLTVFRFTFASHIKLENIEFEIQTKWTHKTNHKPRTNQTTANHQGHKKLPKTVSKPHAAETNSTNFRKNGSFCLRFMVFFVSAYEISGSGECNFVQEYLLLWHSNRRPKLKDVATKGWNHWFFYGRWDFCPIEFCFVVMCGVRVCVRVCACVWFGIARSMCVCVCTLDDVWVLSLFSTLLCRVHRMHDCFWGCVRVCVDVSWCLFWIGCYVMLSCVVLCWRCDAWVGLLWMGEWVVCVFLCVHVRAWVYVFSAFVKVFLFLFLCVCVLFMRVRGLLCVCVVCLCCVSVLCVWMCLVLCVCFCGCFSVWCLVVYGVWRLVMAVFVWCVWGVCGCECVLAWVYKFSLVCCWCVCVCDSKLLGLCVCVLWTMYECVH